MYVPVDGYGGWTYLDHCRSCTVVPSTHLNNAILASGCEAAKESAK